MKYLHRVVYTDESRGETGFVTNQDDETCEVLVDNNHEKTVSSSEVVPVYEEYSSDNIVYPVTFESVPVLESRKKYREIADKVLDIFDSNTVFIAGSFAARLIQPESFKSVDSATGIEINVDEPGDIDLFLYHSSDFDSAHSALIASDFTWENPDSETAIGNVYTHNDIGYKINLIKNVSMGNRQTYGYPETVMSTFDFRCAQAAYTGRHAKDESRGFVIANNMLVDDYVNLRIVLNHMHAPVRTMQRYLRYVRKGYILDWSFFCQILIYAARLDEESISDIKRVEELYRLSEGRMRDVLLESGNLPEVAGYSGSFSAGEAALMLGDEERKELFDRIYSI